MSGIPCSAVGGGGGEFIHGAPIPMNVASTNIDDLLTESSDGRVAVCTASGLLGMYPSTTSSSAGRYDIADGGMALDGSMRRMITTGPVCFDPPTSTLRHMGDTMGGVPSCRQGLFATAADSLTTSSALNTSSDHMAHLMDPSYCVASGMENGLGGLPVAAPPLNSVVKVNNSPPQQIMDHRQSDSPFSQSSGSSAQSVPRLEHVNLQNHVGGMADLNAGGGEHDGLHHHHSNARDLPALLENQERINNVRMQIEKQDALLRSLTRSRQHDSPPQLSHHSGNRAVSPVSSNSSGEEHKTTMLVEMLRKQQDQLQRQQAIQSELVRALNQNKGNPMLTGPTVNGMPTYETENQLLDQLQIGAVGGGVVGNGPSYLLAEYVQGQKLLKQRQIMLDRQRHEVQLMKEQEALEHRQQQQAQEEANRLLRQQQEHLSAHGVQPSSVPFDIRQIEQLSPHLMSQADTIVTHGMGSTQEAETSFQTPIGVCTTTGTQPMDQALQPSMPAASNQNSHDAKTSEASQTAAAPTTKPGARKRKANVGATSKSGQRAIDMDESDPDNQDQGDPGDNMYQSLKWKANQSNNSCRLASSTYQDLGNMVFKMEADKGFTFSLIDDAFVCQKKNHFQLTVFVQLPDETAYVNTEDGYSTLESLYIDAYGIKMESPLADHILLEQSTKADRKRYSFKPVAMNLSSERTSKSTIMRLHFSKTTENNGRKKGKPNSDQRYFSLVVNVLGRCADGKDHVLASQTSERIIVRATNPSQFETDVEVTWRRCQQPDSIYHVGRVGINNERPEETLDVHGNVRVTGNIYKQSDERVKENIEPLDDHHFVDNIQKVKVYRYDYTSEYAQAAGLPEDSRTEVGVIAQEVREVLPDAVKEVGDVELPGGEKVDGMLVVNKDRIYMESVGAVQELCKVTGDLETRIHGLEGVRKKRMAERKKAKSGYGCMMGVGGCIPVKYDEYSYPERQNSNGSVGCGVKKELQVEAKDVGTSVCSPTVMKRVIAALLAIILISVGAMIALYVLKDNGSDTTTNNIIFYNVPYANGTAPPAINASTSYTPEATAEGNDPLPAFAPAGFSPKLPDQPPIARVCAEESMKQDRSLQGELLNCLPKLPTASPDYQDISQCCDPDFQSGFTLQPILLTPRPPASRSKPEHPGGIAEQAIRAPSVPKKRPTLQIDLEIPDVGAQSISPEEPNASSYYMVLQPHSGYDTVNLTLSSTIPYAASYCFPAVSRQSNCNVNSSVTLQIVDDAPDRSHVFELPIALSLEMWHGIRVYPPGSTATCTSPDSEEGKTFWSYNFFFDHECSG